ncbi:MAG TPA: OsmC family protein [Burkholderiales bacterium]
MSTDHLKAALQSKIAAIQSKRAVARLVFRAHTRLEQGVRCSASVRDFAAIAVDEPPDLGGEDTAMNPVELLLVALGTCQEIVYAAYAAVLGIPLESVSVDVKGYLDLRGLLSMDESVPAGYERITFDTQIRSPADAEAVEQLVRITEAHCPLLDTLKRPIDVRGCVSLNGRRLAPSLPVAA